MSRVLCEGCGRLGGEREVYCPACGRPLPGRTAEPSEAAPPGWLVASERGAGAPVFEPLPSLTAALPSGGPSTATYRSAPSPAWKVQLRGVAGAAGPEVPAAGGIETADERDGGTLVLLPPPPLPLEGEAAVLDPAARPPLRALYMPLLALVVVSSVAAVVLLLVHVLQGR